jgi:hypothetical protein
MSLTIVTTDTLLHYDRRQFLESALWPYHTVLSMGQIVVLSWCPPVELKNAAGKKGQHYNKHR